MSQEIHNQSRPISVPSCTSPRLTDENSIPNSTAVPDDPIRKTLDKQSSEGNFLGQTMPAGTGDVSTLDITSINIKHIPNENEGNLKKSLENIFTLIADRDIPDERQVVFNQSEDRNDALISPEDKKEGFQLAPSDRQGTDPAAQEQNKYTANAIMKALGTKWEGAVKIFLNESLTHNDPVTVENLKLLKEAIDREAPEQGAVSTSEKPQIKLESIPKPKRDIDLSPLDSFFRLADNKDLTDDRQVVFYQEDELNGKRRKLGYVNSGIQQAHPGRLGTFSAGKKRNEVTWNCLTNTLIKNNILIDRNIRFLFGEEIRNNAPMTVKHLRILKDYLYNMTDCTVEQLPEEIKTRHINNTIKLMSYKQIKTLEYFFKNIDTICEKLNTCITEIEEYKDNSLFSDFRDNNQLIKVNKWNKIEQEYEDDNINKFTQTSMKRAIKEFLINISNIYDKSNISNGLNDFAEILRIVSNCKVEERSAYTQYSADLLIYTLNENII